MSAMRNHGRTAVLFLFLVLLLPACGGDDKADAVTAPAGPPPTKVGVIKIEPSAMRDVLVLPGSTEADQDVLLAAERDGRVDAVLVADGQPVKKGQLLAEIDVAALRAGLDRAEANHKLTKELAQRRKSLHKRGVLPQEELEKAETEYQLAAGTLREARVWYEQGFVRSPINGVVNKMFVDPGEYVGGGQPVAEVVNVDTIRVNVSAPEMDVRFIAEDQKALVVVDAYPDRKWLGQVSFVAYKADDATRTFRVRLLVDNADGAIRPGMIARAYFQRRLIQDAVAAPLAALLDQGGERILFVEKDGVAQARTVRLGVIEGDRVQILEGLAPGENLIVTGQSEIEDGMRVVTQ